MGLVERSFYERQGAERSAAGRAFDCSMETTNGAVIAITEHYASEFAACWTSDAAPISLTIYPW